MKQWKKWILTALVGTSLVSAPIGLAQAASTTETILYGVAAAALIKQQLSKMDRDGQPQMLAQVKDKTGVSGDLYSQQRLERITARLVQTGMIKRDYDVYANPSQELNAFETIGGVISVNQGMMNVLDDDELAFTLCHEMQHGEHHHAINGVMKSIGVSLAVDLAFGGNADVLDVLLGGIAVNYIDNELITMDQEKQADADGFNVLKNTNFNVGGAPSSMQLVYEKYGDLYREGFGRVLSPNNHPQMSSRIEKLGQRMTRWSGNHVQVGGDTVYVNALPVLRPAPSGDYSSRRRAFLVAGNLARVTHNVYGEAENDKKVVTTPLTSRNVTRTDKDTGTVKIVSKGTAAASSLAAANVWNIQQNGADLSVNGQRIMTLAGGDDGTKIRTELQTALTAKPKMLSEKEIRKLDNTWKKQYGFEATQKKEKAKAESDKGKVVAPAKA